MLGQADPMTRTSQSCVAVIKPTRATACAAQKSKGESSRRAMVGGLGLALSAAAAKPSFALFGLFEEKLSPAEIYEKDTAKAIKAAREALEVPLGDPQRDQKLLDYKKEAQFWVAKYRADKSFKGRMSYQDMYSVFNAISGHYNSFGNQAPIPKKRLEVIVKEINEAETFLTRGR